MEFLDVDISIAFPNMSYFTLMSGLTEIPWNPLVGHQSLFEMDLRENKITRLPENAIALMPRLFQLTLTENPITELGTDSFYVASTEYDSNIDVALDNTPLSTLPSSLFGPAGPKKDIGYVQLSENQLTDFPEETFKDVILNSLVYDDYYLDEINMLGNPMPCCALGWVFLEGAKYGEEYQDKVSIDCAFTEGAVSEFNLWDMTCNDFEQCQDVEGMEDFVTECLGIDLQPLPEPTPGPEKDGATRELSSFAFVKIIALAFGAFFLS